MMVFSVYDRVSGLFGDPWPSINKDCAIRMFKSTMKRNTNYFASDMDLFYLGELDQKTGVLVGLEKPEFIYRMSDAELTGIYGDDNG